MPIILLDPWALVASGQPYTTTLPLGAGWAPGDVRLYFLSTSSSRSFTSASDGWSWLRASSSAASVSRTTAVLARELQAGDTDPQLTVSSPFGPNVAHLAVTIRGADVAALMGATPAMTGSSSNSSSVTAPSVAVGAGVLLTAHWITRTSGANSGDFAAPAGMTRQAWTLSDGPGGYNAVLASLPTTSGTSDARSASAASAGSWSAASLFVPEAAVAAGPEPGRALLAV